MGNKNTIIGLILIFAIFIGYSYFMTPSKKEIEARQKREDSIRVEKAAKRNAEIKAIAREQAIRETEMKKRMADVAPGDTLNVLRNILRDKMGQFAGSATGNREYYYIENELIRLRLSNEGGRISQVQLKNYKTWDDRPLILFDNDSLQFGITFFSNNRLISTDKLFFQPVTLNGQPIEPGKSLAVAGKDSLQFAMRVYADAGDTAFDKGKYIEFRYTLHGDQYMMGYTVNFSGMENIIDAGTKFIQFTWNANLKRQEKSLKMERMNSTIYFRYLEDKVDYLSETEDEEKVLKSERVDWVSFKQQFFTSTLISSTYFSEPRLRTLTHTGGSTYMKSMLMDLGLAYTPGETKSIPMSLFFGPNNFYTLKSYNIDLERQIPLGWGFFLLGWINIYAVIPVFNFLGQFGWNYGIIILILTILIKIVLFPIAFKTYKSSAKMRALKPDIDQLGEKFPRKEDAMKKQQATMELYKRAGVNPMAGCIPLLLQMPILIAMFRFFPSSIELRQQAFLWAQDLSSYDSVLNLGFSIPWYGDHVSLFALLMTISSVIYTRINDQMMGSSQQQLPGMKTMMYLMPIMFLFWFNDYSSGLSYYYLLANLLTFAQIYIIRATIDEKKLHAQIEANKKKPVKKSGFQKRLEDMAKKQQQMAKRR